MLQVTEVYMCADGIEPLYRVTQNAVGDLRVYLGDKLVTASELLARLTAPGFKTVCPCTLVEPCKKSCTCAHPHLSGGCERCASYGDAERRRATAARIAARAEELFQFRSASSRAQNQLPEPTTEEQEALLERPISAMGFCVRARRLMLNQEITTVGQLITWSASDLLRCRNFGVSSLRDIMGRLADVGLHLRRDPADQALIL